MGNSTSVPTKQELVSKFSHFDKDDVKMWNSQFETIFPLGYATIENFGIFLTILFPFGSSKKFSEILFRNINLSGTNKIDITELLISFSILTHGSDFEKIRWTYRLLDNDMDGIISKEDMNKTINAYNEMLGDMFEDENENFVEEFFEKLGIKSGFLSFEIFRRHVEKEGNLQIFNFF